MYLPMERQVSVARGMASAPAACAGEPPAPDSAGRPVRAAWRLRSRRGCAVPPGRRAPAAS